VGGGVEGAVGGGGGGGLAPFLQKERDNKQARKQARARPREGRRAAVAAASVRAARHAVCVLPGLFRRERTSGISGSWFTIRWTRAGNRLLRLAGRAARVLPGLAQLPLPAVSQPLPLCLPVARRGGGGGASSLPLRDHGLGVMRRR